MTTEKEFSTKLELWEKNLNNPLLINLKKGLSFQQALEKLPGFKKSFRPLDTIDCSDGRVLQGGKIGLAGSGIMLSPEARAEFARVYKGKIKVVTSHDDCGAAKNVFANLDPNELPAGIKTADDYGRWQAHNFAVALEARHDHLSLAEMAEKQHNEAGLSIDGTGEFDSTHLEGFPPHFVCSAAGFGLADAYIITEAEALAEIAFDHGFGELFKAENLFRLMIIANNREQAEHLLKVARPLIIRYGDRIKAELAVRP